MQELQRQEQGDEEGAGGRGGSARGRLREGDALARLAAAESSRAARVERNNFKCSLCHRVRFYVLGFGLDYRSGCWSWAAAARRMDSNNCKLLALPFGPISGSSSRRKT